MRITVFDLLELCDACDHNIVIYDENVVDTNPDWSDCADILWTDSSDRDVPGDVLAMEVVSFDLEEDLFRIWANGEGIANKYRYEGWNL